MALGGEEPIPELPAEAKNERNRHRHSFKHLFDNLRRLAREIKDLSALVSGNIGFALPDNYTLDSVPSDSDTIEVNFEVQEDSYKNELFEGEVTVSTSDSSADTGSTSTDSPITVSNGLGTVTVTFADNWQEGDSFTLTVDSQDICGYTISSASVTISI